MICSKCGNPLDEGVKFCSECGTVIENDNGRRTIYEGEIHKCPNCGEVLNSFASNCPACGYELRGIEAVSSVQQLTEKLEKIDAREMPKYEGKRSLLKTVFGRDFKDTDDERDARDAFEEKKEEEKANLIINYVVPNTKEDMLEFMILATSNINMETYDLTKTYTTKGEKAINEAWHAKVQQVYEKAKISFSSDDTFTEIKQLYDKCNDDIKKTKKKGIYKISLFVGGFVILWVILIGWLLISESKEETKELERLDNIVVEVQAALENEEYKHALRIADSIDYQRHDEEMERRWDIQRAYWTDEVIEEAAKKGIKLEYTPSVDIDNANDDTEDEIPSSGFIEGIKEGAQPGIDALSKSIDELNSITNDKTDNNNYIEFTTGFEKAEFSKYNSPASENGLGGSKIYIEGILDKTELLETGDTKTILGYVTGNDGNIWLVKMHVIPIVSESYFDSAVGKKVIIKVVYDGYSKVKQMPSTTLYELLITESGTIYSGMQKLLDE